MSPEKTAKRDFVFYISSVHPPELLSVLRALDVFREHVGMEYVQLHCSDVMRNLVEEFKYDSIICTGEVVNEDSSRVNLDRLIAAARDSDPLDFTLSSSLRALVAGTSNARPSALRSDIPFSISRHTRLGDALSILSGCEAYCQVNGVEGITISANGAFADVAKVFKLEHIKVISDAATADPSWDKLFTHASWTIPWLKRFSNELFRRYGGSRPEVVRPLELISPVPELPELRNVVYCQFDSRSHQITNINSIVRTVKRFFGEIEFRVLGGKETEYYLGAEYPYDLDELRGIVTRLSNCSWFVGCDSGLAHVAGALGKRSIVVNFADLESVKEFFRSYPNTTVLDRSFLENF